MFDEEFLLHLFGCLHDFGNHGICFFLFSFDICSFVLHLVVKPLPLCDLLLFPGLLSGHLLVDKFDSLLQHFVVKDWLQVGKSIVEVIYFLSLASLMQRIL